MNAARHLFRRRARSASPDALLATWFGIGLIPGAPGTYGSLVAVPLAWVIVHYWGLLGLAIAIVALFLVGTWAAGRYARARGIADPGAIVVDEVVGQWLALVLVPPDIMAYALGFALFRLFDVIKPWPISLLDRRLKGGFGVMADDVLAGAMAAIVLWNIWIWIGP